MSVSNQIHDGRGDTVAKKPASDGGPEGESFAGRQPEHMGSLIPDFHCAFDPMQ